MKINEFINEIEEVLELEDSKLHQNTNLNDLPEFDSLATMSIIALIDEKFGRRLTGEQLLTITTVRSLIELIGLENFGD